METGKFTLHLSIVDQYPSKQFPVTELFWIKGVTLSLPIPSLINCHFAFWGKAYTSSCHSWAVVIYYFKTSVVQIWCLMITVHLQFSNETQSNIYLICWKVSKHLFQCKWFPTIISNQYSDWKGQKKKQREEKKKKKSFKNPWPWDHHP